MTDFVIYLKKRQCILEPCTSGRITTFKSGTNMDILVPGQIKQNTHISNILTIIPLVFVTLFKTSSLKYINKTPVVLNYLFTCL